MLFIHSFQRLIEFVLTKVENAKFATECYIQIRVFLGGTEGIPHNSLSVCKYAPYNMPILPVLSFVHPLLSKLKKKNWVTTKVTLKRANFKEWQSILLDPIGRLGNCIRRFSWFRDHVLEIQEA